MAYDQNTRNRLQRFVSEARNLLSGEFTRQFQQKYGLDASSGEVSELKRMVHLNDREMETARMLRDTLAHYMASSPSGGKRECLERMIREQAFTVLNRLCALRMAEAREIIIESLSRTYNSKGFQLYARLAGTALGETGDAYRAYIFSLFDELALDLPVLFDRFSPQGYLFPGEGVLLELLAMMNESDLSPLWVEDETIGWIYQYFNSLDERRQMRSESQAPRNSRELAVRNQFFTPRYVVEFLTDNTLGRLWYEMTRGETQLKDSCSYLVRRPQEIFLAAGEEAPEIEESTDDLSQEEMLQQAVYIPYRPLKDPREILMLDPACGSMHFGLYAFDLYEKIYEEAWDMESKLGFRVFERSENLQSLQQTYASREEFLRDVPRLIVECNIHGVDIESRAVQIAGLSLWLRAQRSWLYQGIKPQQRPQIRKSNVVCAEPMPGEKGMLEEFAGKLKPRVLGQLVDMIFDKMQMAGEAGSLLKIEEEIEEALNLAREEFQKEIQIRNEDRSTLFPDIIPPRQASLFDFTDLGDKTRFWNCAEERLLDALREYAEQAEDTDAVQKRLFAQDAARGFAFIDLFRKRYDVVLMNPPFGEANVSTIEYMNSKYEGWFYNILSAFLFRSWELTRPLGLVGSIFDRTVIIKSSYDDFRNTFFLNGRKIQNAADTGWDVLDANVETFCMTMNSLLPDDIAIFFDLRREPSLSKRKLLLDAVYGSNVGRLHSNETLSNTVAFRKLPNSVIGYDLPKFLLSALAHQGNLEENGFKAYQGHALEAGVHYRLWWEVNLWSDFRWAYAFKGGEFSPYYLSNVDIAYYGDNGDVVPEKTSNVLRNKDKQGTPGVAFGKRGEYLDAQPLAQNQIFTHEGHAMPGIAESYRWPVLALLNSKLFSFGINSYCGQHKTSGYVNLFPSFKKEDSLLESIGSRSKQIYEVKSNWHRGDETDPVFISTFIFNSYPFSNEDLNTLCKRIFSIYTKKTEAICKWDDEIDKNLQDHFKLDEEERKELFERTATRQKLSLWTNHETIDLNIFTKELIAELISYMFGNVFGRWDIRYAIGQKELPKLLDPFAPLPVCSPGMLQNDQGLPASEHDIPDDYPLCVSWSGILVDDEAQTEDIVARVREAIEVIWKEKAGDIEQEACEILGVDSLRDYFRKPGNFFAEHLKRYSKSRRQAPIYWPLSTTSGSYTIWLYYQRLNDQTLYRCVNDYVEPKLKQVMESARQLRQKSGRSRQEEKELEELLDLEKELREFRDELLRIAAFWKPNLNDGVQITAAPLWKLFRLPKWRTTLKETWGKLEKGDYDWAHLAYSIWPERVREKCKHDKSLAIAHELEDIYEEPVAQAKKKGGRSKKNT